MNSKHGKYNSAPTAKRFMVAGAIAVVLACASTAVQADISISPPNPQEGSTVAVSACVILRENTAPSGILVKLDGKPPVNNSNPFGYCDQDPLAFAYGVYLGTGVGFGAQAIVDNRPTPPITAPTVPLNVGQAGDHTLTIVVEYPDGSQQYESKVIRVLPPRDVARPQMQAVPGAPNPPIQWGGSPGPSLSPATKPMAQMGAAPAPAWSGPVATGKRSVPFITLSLSHGPSGSRVQVNACSVPGPQGSQYDVSVDNVNAYFNLPLAACGSGKFGFGAGTSLPPITVTVTGSPASRHTINVTNLGSATFIVDP